MFSLFNNSNRFFILADGNYDKEVADFVISKRETLMVDRRDFIKFREFNKQLVEITNGNRSKTIPELYPQLLDACRAIN